MIKENGIISSKCILNSNQTKMSCVDYEFLFNYKQYFLEHTTRLKQEIGMPRLAVFPKGFMEQLVKTGSMSLIEWIKLASKLNVDGLEFYSNFIDLKDPSQFETLLNTMDDFGLAMPMMCCSPDFTHPDVDYRLEQIELEKSWIDLTASLGGKYCRVLTGQRRPDVSIDDGLNYAVDCINECLTYASNKGITLILENHYKDDFWEFPEFAQYMDVFCDLIDRIDSPRFGIRALRCI